MNQIWDDEKNHWCMNGSKEFSHISMVWLGLVYRLLATQTIWSPEKNHSKFGKTNILSINCNPPSIWLLETHKRQ